MLGKSGENGWCASLVGVFQKATLTASLTGLHEGEGTMEQKSQC